MNKSLHPVPIRRSFKANHTPLLSKEGPGVVASSLAVPRTVGEGCPSTNNHLPSTKMTKTKTIKHKLNPCAECGQADKLRITHTCISCQRCGRYSVCTTNYGTAAIWNIQNPQHRNQLPMNSKQLKEQIRKEEEKENRARKVAIIVFILLLPFLAYIGWAIYAGILSSFM